MPEKSNLQKFGYSKRIIINICRIIYTIFNSRTENKQRSASWVKEQYSEWKGLIEEAERWDYTREMNKQDEIKEFIKGIEYSLHHSNRQPPKSPTHPS